MILKVRKMPVIVEAVQFTGSDENIDFLYKWSNGQVWLKSETVLNVKCLEAVAETPVGSYIVKGVLVS